MKKSRFDGLEPLMRGQSAMPSVEAREPSDAPATDDTDAEEGDEEEEDTDMKNDTDKKPEAEAKGAPTSSASEQALATDAVATARAEERQRIADVFASDDVKGREMAAAELLANSDMAADKIVAMLPKLGASTSNDDADTMLSQMREDGQTDLGSDDTEMAAAENHGWTKLHEEIQQERGL